MLLSVGVEANTQNLLQKGAPLYCVVLSECGSEHLKACLQPHFSGVTDRVTRVLGARRGPSGTERPAGALPFVVGRAGPLPVSSSSGSTSSHVAIRTLSLIRIPIPFECDCPARTVILSAATGAGCTCSPQEIIEGPLPIRTLFDSSI